MTNKNDGQVIPFTRAEMIALQRLAARYHMAPVTLIRRIVATFLDRGLPLGDDAQRGLPFSAEIGRLIVKVDAARHELDSARRKRNAAPPRLGTPKHRM